MPRGTPITGAASITAVPDAPKAPPTKKRTRRPTTGAEKHTMRTQIKQAYSSQSKSQKRTYEALTAAAELMDPTDPNSYGGKPNAVARTWQHAAWGYTRVVPELSAGMIYTGSALSRVKVIVGKRNPDGTVEPGFSGDDPVDGLNEAAATEAAEHINHLRSPKGGQSELLRSFGEKIFVSGECYVLPEDTPAGLMFDCLSTQELAKEGESFVRYYGPGGDTKPVPDDIMPIRIWRPDSQFGQLANSSVRACLEILEELVILTRLVKASSISRMALSGILAIADEFDFPEDDEDEDGQTSEPTNPLITDIINTAVKAVDDPASAAAFVPFIFQGPADLIDKGIKYISFQGDTSENVVKRREALERLAQGLDLPVEVILGFQGTTFANAAQISEDTFKLHIEPLLQLFCDAMTVAFLWPAMAETRGIQPEHLEGTVYPDDILSVAVTFDASALISRPDRAENIVDMFIKDQTHTAVAQKEVRAALGLPPEGGPDILETSIRLDALRLGKIRETIAAPVADGAVSLQAAYEGKATKPGESAGSQLAGNQEAAAAAAQEAADAKAAAHPPAASADAAAMRSIMLDAFALRVSGAAEITVERAVEKVGAKLRTKATANQRPSIAEVANDHVASVFGATAVKRMLGRDDPIAAEAAAFGRTVARWALETGLATPDEIGELGRRQVADMAREKMFNTAVTTHLGDEAWAKVLTPA